jgi:hypothetical protein
MEALLDEIAFGARSAVFLMAPLVGQKAAVDVW